MTELELLAKSIFDKSLTSLEKIDPCTFKKIEDIGIQDYLFILFRDYPQIFVDFHLMANQELWIDLKERPWEEVIFKLQDLEISLYTLISFLHKYTKINAILFYEKMNPINKNVRDSVLNYFSERPGLLKIQKQERIYFGKNKIKIPS